MIKRCAVCNKIIIEVAGKVHGTIINVKNEKKEKEFVYVCPNCEKDKDWVERAVVRAA